ncbi:MAG: phospholipase D family protein [Deltaproteobacteria bacterium]|nr:phospholipase D family protein [Deltaproteobacteria bacterium]
MLDRAICTTYTLDLISLLMAPLSMALYEAQNQKEMMQDPIAVLEALRRTADRIAVFCQKGRITLPKNNTRLVSLLEKTVIQVEPPDDSGVFHPKTWVLRFTADDEPTIYRFLCLSRNLTFDRSWDTILSLEGKETERQRAYSRNRPLFDFMSSLPEMATEKVSPNIRSLVELMAKEVLTVNFDPPPDVEDFGLLPMGIPGYRKKPDWGEPSRIMIVSPFLSQSQLSVLAELGTDNVLVSRPESLDEISDETLKEVEQNCEIFIMDQDAEVPEPDEETQADEGAGIELTQFTGLHAKMFIIESGWDSSLYTGSANFSDPALNGRNVEFMVELQGKRSKLGIDKFLGGGDERNSFRAMLRRYSRASELKKDRSAERELERILDEARTTIASAGIEALVAPAEQNLFDMVITVAEDFANKFDSVSGSFYPISLKSSSGKPINELQRGESVKFGGITPIALTSFFAFEIEAKVEDKSAAIAFVLNIPVENMPEDRDNRLLHYLISDQKSFICYLLFILMEGDGRLLASDLVSMTAKQESDDGFDKYIIGFQLLEELVRSYSRNPERIDRIAKLVDDLGQTPEGRSLFPPGFEEVWSAFVQARGLKEAAQ